MRESAVNEIGMLSEMLMRVVRAFISSHDRHEVATMMTMGVCRALLTLYPERAIDGRTIIEIMSQQMLRFPLPKGYGMAEGEGSKELN